MRQATAWHVLNAEDAQIIEEDTAGHHRRGTDPGSALEELKLCTVGQPRELAEEHERDRKAPSGTSEQPELDPR